MGTHPIFESDFDCLTGMSAFDSESLFTAFDQVGWNKAQAPTIDDAYEQLPDESDTDKVRRLQLENARLKRVVSLLVPPKPVKDQESGPLCQLNFYHNQLSRHHKDQIIKLVTNFIQEAEQEREMDLFDPLPFQRSSISLPSNGEDYDEFKVIQSVQIFPNGYYFDRIGEPIGAFEPKDAFWVMPEYQAIYRDVLTENPEDDLGKIESSKKKMAKVCFNCGAEGCSIAKCPHPRNPAEINKRKEEFNKMFGSSTPRGPNIRLFEAGDGHAKDKRFANFKPGSISQELRKALGYTECQLPEWIYQIRKYGYPPGWLKEATVRESGVSVQEEGEVNEISISNTDERKIVGLDSSKIVSYPGYNVQMPDGVPDNHSRETPKFSEKDDRKLFIVQFCQRNNCEIIEPKKRTLSSDDDQLSPKKAKIR